MSMYSFIFFTRNKERVQFPFNAHEEHSVLSVHVLVKVYDVTLIVGDELRQFRYYALLIGAM